MARTVKRISALVAALFILSTNASAEWQRQVYTDRLSAEKIIRFWTPGIGRVEQRGHTINTRFEIGCAKVYVPFFREFEPGQK
jgi:hypothetical protein